MSSNFPAGIDSYPVHQDNAGEKIAASAINNIQDAIVAIENALGINLSKVQKNDRVTEYFLNSTSATNVLSTSPTQAVNYQVLVYLRVINASTNVTVSVSYTDASGNQTNTMLPSQSLTVGSHSLIPLFINVTSGSSITVSVTAGTANQVYVSSSIMGV